MGKAVAILGSRNPAGQTARATDAVLEGLCAAGWEVRKEFLPTLRIERCRQCDERGWGDCRARGSCVIEDDFAALVEAIRNSDCVVFATPVYFGDLSESFRAFTDRLRRICRHENGRAGIEGKRALALCVAGGGGGGSPACAESLDRVLRTIGFDLVDVIPLRRQNLAFKLTILPQHGKWLAAGAPESWPGP
jgi:multimeric flavodoxin WrbA